MKFVFLALFASVFALSVHNRALIQEINSKASSWRAAPGKFADWTIEEMQAILKTETPNNVADVAPLRDDLPVNFNYGDKWPSCVGPVRDQARCGSCWAFALTESLTDRFCIAGCPSPLLSPQDLVSCDYMDHGCNGGNLYQSWTWAKTKGVSSDTCMPYTAANGTVAKCPSTCTDGSEIVRYKAQSFAHIPAAKIQEELFNNGPIEVGFDVYEDFMHYAGGVYKHTTGSRLGGHAVVIVGWGVDAATNTPYWNVQNSWNTNWGEKGFFRIIRGKNDCNFESSAYSGVPQC